jgi:hypothetical protein
MRPDAFEQIIEQFDDGLGLFRSLVGGDEERKSLV